MVWPIMVWPIMVLGDHGLDDHGLDDHWSRILRARNGQVNEPPGSSQRLKKSPKMSAERAAFPPTGKPVSRDTRETVARAAAPPTTPPHPEWRAAATRKKSGRAGALSIPSSGESRPRIPD